MASVASSTERRAGLCARVLARAVRRVCGRRRHALIPDVEAEVRAGLDRLRAREGARQPELRAIYRLALVAALEELHRHAPARRAAAVQDAPEEPRRLGRAVFRLPLDQARAVRGSLAGLRDGQVAMLFGWTVADTHQRIDRGLAALRRRLERSRGYGPA